MAASLVADDLWALIEPLSPPHPPYPKEGRPPIPDWACFTGIVFVLKTGIQWEELPQELGCSSGITCWRRFRDWQKAGVVDRLQELILARPKGAGCLDWSRAVMDASLVCAKCVEKGAKPLGSTPRTGCAP